MAKKKEIKKTTFKDWQTQIIVLVIFVLLGTGIWFYLGQQPRIPANAQSYIIDYTKYLKKTSGTAEDVNVYLEKAVDNANFTHYITIYNKTTSFYCGTLELVDANNKVIFGREFVNIRPTEVRIIGINIKQEPEDYKLKNSLFFKYSYPNTESKGDISADNDAVLGYAWTNVVFEDEDLTVENCMAYIKNIFVQDVLAGMPSNDIYFYKTSTVEYTEENGIQFPKTNSAEYVAALDQGAKKVYLAKLENGKAEVVSEEIVK